MGLFKKRATDPAEMERLQSEIAAMSARLDEADAAKQELASRLHGLDRQLEERRVAPPPSPPPPSPLVSAADLEVLRARIQRLSDRVDETVRGGAEAADSGDLDQLRDRIEALDARIDSAVSPRDAVFDQTALVELRGRLEELTHRFDSPLSTPPPPEPPSAPVTTADGDALTEVHERLDAIGARLDEVDLRITSISTELANQISELSGDIDTMSGREPATDDVVDDLRDAQSRLANEQARYQIAFRQDLADLAERLKRS